MSDVFSLGNILTLKALSPPIIIFRPPDPFWIEIESAGYFVANSWVKDMNSFEPSVEYSFIHFHEIYYVERSYHVFQGRYTVRQITFFDESSISPPQNLHFDVIAHGIVTNDLYWERFSVLYVQLIQPPEQSVEKLCCLKDKVETSPVFLLECLFPPLPGCSVATSRLSTKLTNPQISLCLVVPLVMDI